MPATTSTTTPSSGDDAATYQLVVETDGVRRDVSITVSPRPIDGAGWANVVRALSDYVAAHPERF
jgi:hypothetical protein